MTLATTLLSMLFGISAAVAVAWPMKGAGDVRNASREVGLGDTDGPFRQSWICMTRVPSMQVMEAMREATVEAERATEDRLGRFAVKLAIVDSADDAAE